MNKCTFKKRIRKKERTKERNLKHKKNKSESKYSKFRWLTQKGGDHLVMCRSIRAKREKRKLDNGSGSLIRGLRRSA